LALGSELDASTVAGSSHSPAAAAVGLATPTRGRILSLVSGFSLSLGRRSARKVHAEAATLLLAPAVATAEAATAAGVAGDATGVICASSVASASGAQAAAAAAQCPPV
jgi:hypothetical protein